MDSDFQRQRQLGLLLAQPLKDLCFLCDGYAGADSDFQFQLGLLLVHPLEDDHCLAQSDAFVQPDAFVLHHAQHHA